MVGLIIIFIGGFLLGYSISYLTTSFTKDIDEYIEIDPKHMEPSWYYEGGFGTVSQCGECRITGYHMDLNTYKPCPNCGGQVVKLRNPHKWMKDQHGNHRWVSRREFKWEEH